MQRGQHDVDARDRALARRADAAVRADYRRLATRLVGNDDADDVVQDACARLITYDRWREIDNPRAMCLRTVRNLALDRLRSADVVHKDRIADVESLDIADECPDAFWVTICRSPRFRGILEGSADRAAKPAVRCAETLAGVISEGVGSGGRQARRCSDEHREQQRIYEQAVELG
jgi:hypothetical protein